MSQPVHDIRWATLAPVGLVAALFLIPAVDPAPYFLLVATWAGACFAAEALWHRALDERTPLLMAPAAHLAALAALPPIWGVPLVTIAAFLGAKLWRRDSFPLALHHAVTIAGAGTAALGVLRLGGLHASVPGQGPNLLRAPQELALVAAAGVVFLLLYQISQSAVTSRRTHVSVGRAWRDVYGRETEIVASGALVIVSVLALVAYQALGYRGLFLCVMPILFVRDGSRRNVELASAQSKLIKNERLAAKGEMAAEIGHELNNYLAAISGRAQLLLRNLTGVEMSPLAVEATRVRDIANRMAELSRGLMDFSHRETKRTPFGVNELIEKTVEFVRPQTRFRSWVFDLSPDPTLPRVEMDPGQIQQVLLILLQRVADVSPTGKRRLTVRTFSGEDHRSVGIEIGPAAGLSEGSEDAERGSTSLATARRIVERQRGRLELADDRDETSVRVILPAA